MPEMPEILPPESREIVSATSTKWRRPVALGLSAATCFGLVLWCLNQFLSLRGVVHVTASRIVLALGVVFAILGWLSFTRLFPRKGNFCFWSGTAIVILSAGLLDWWAPKPESIKSVLVIGAYMDGAYGPGVNSSQLKLEILNQPEEAVQNLDLTISTASNLRIRSVLNFPFGKHDCKSEPVNLFQNSRLTFRGAQDGRATIDSRDETEEYIRSHGSPQWKLVCPRLSGHTSIIFEVIVAGDVEKDSMRVSGTYERIPSKGSGVVEVNSVVPITK